MEVEENENQWHGVITTFTRDWVRCYYYHRIKSVTESFYLFPYILFLSNFFPFLIRNGMLATHTNTHQKLIISFVKNTTNKKLINENK